MTNRITSLIVLPILIGEEVICSCGKHISGENVFVVTFSQGISAYIRCKDCVKYLLSEVGL